jgi:hypothetical protein
MCKGPAMARIVTTTHRYKRAPKKRMPQPAIATPIVKKTGKWDRFGDTPDLTSEENQRRGDAADALFWELVRRGHWRGMMPLCTVTTTGTT